MAAKMKYEDAVKRLEEILLKLDDGGLPLDESIKLFEESTKLVVFCNDYLEKAKLKVTELSKSE